MKVQINHNKFSKTFLKLFVSYILVLILTVSIIGILAYRTTNKNMKDQISQHNIKILNHVNSIFDIHLTNIESIAVNISLNRNVFNVLRPANNLQLDLYKTMHHISNTVNTNEIIKNIYLYDIGDNEVLFASGGKSKDTLFFEEKWLNKMKQNEFEEKWVRTTLQESVTIDGIGGELLYFQKIPVMGNKSYGFIIIIIDERSFWETYNQILSDENSQLIILNHKNEFFASNHELVDFEQIKKYEDRITGADEGSYIEGADEGKQIVSYRTSSRNNWKFIYVNKWDVQTLFLQKIRRALILISLIAILIGLIICYSISKKMYLPISNFMHYLLKGSMMERLVFTSNDNKYFIDEFKYMLKYIDNIKDTNHNLQSFFNANSEMVKKEIINNLFEGKYEDEYNIINSLSKIDDRFKHGYFTATLADIDDNFKTKTNGKDRWECLRAVKEIAGELLQDKNVLVFETHNDSLAILFITEEKTKKDKLIDDITSLQQEITVRLNINISFGIGRTCDDIISISESYHDASRALKFRLIFGKNNVIHIEDVSKVDGEVLYYYPIKKEKQLVNVIKNGDSENAKVLIEEIIFDIKLMENVSIECIQQGLVRLLGSAINLLLELGGSMKLIFGEDYNAYSELGKNKTLDEMENFMVGVIEKIIDYISELKNSRENQHIHNAKTFIKNNINLDLSLNLIATEVNLNGAYLSNLFKNATGENITKYIQNLKIEKGKELLVETDMNIREIADEMGYNSQHNFIRQFKKHEGITPGQFRQKRIR